MISCHIRYSTGRAFAGLMNEGDTVGDLLAAHELELQPKEEIVIDGRNVSLNTELSDGDVVEIRDQVKGN